jgi:hypothetical protein
MMIDVRIGAALMALATIIAVTIRLVRVAARRARDLGAVSDQWLLHHRGDWRDSASR